MDCCNMSYSYIETKFQEADLVTQAAKLLGKEKGRILYYSTKIYIYYVYIMCALSYSSLDLILLIQ